MIARATLLALVALAGAASVARADDKAKKYEVKSKAVWKAGDTFTTVTAVSHEQTVQITVNGAATKAAGDGLVKVRWTCVERVDTVGTDGRPTKRTIAFTKWAREAGGVADSTLEGTQVSVAGVGPERDWEFLGDAPVASTDAMDWLNEQYGHVAEGTTEPDPLAMFASKGPVAVGATWDVDAKGLPAVSVSGVSAHADENAKTTAKLESADKGLATVSVRGSVPLKGEQSDKMKWAKPPALEITASATIPLDGRFTRLVFKDERVLDASTTVETEGGGSATIRIRLADLTESKSTPGGTIPPPPKLAPEK